MGKFPIFLLHLTTLYLFVVSQDEIKFSLYLISNLYILVISHLFVTFVTWIIRFRDCNFFSNALSRFAPMVIVSSIITSLKYDDDQFPDIGTMHFLFSPHFVIFLTSSTTLRQWVDCLKVINLNKIFTNSRHKVNGYKSNKYVMVSLITVYILYNIITNYYCSLYTEKQDAFNFAHYISMILFLTVYSIPYYIVPDIKYDLFNFKMQIKSFIYFVIPVCIFKLLWCYKLKYFLSEYYLFIILGSNQSLSFSYRFSLPLWLKERKQSKFIKKCQVNNDDILWSNYIINQQNQNENNNYNKFLNFLADIHNVNNLFFIIEIIGYKNRLKQILNKKDINYGYLLPFDVNQNNIFPISPIITDLDNKIKSDINTEDIANIIVEHFKIFTDKYMKEEKDLLTLSFISEKQRKAILNKLYVLDLRDDDSIEMITNIINTFDKALENTHTVIQLLYNEYQLQLKAM